MTKHIVVEVQRGGNLLDAFVEAIGRGDIPLDENGIAELTSTTGLTLGYDSGYMFRESENEPTTDPVVYLLDSERGVIGETASPHQVPALAAQWRTGAK